MKKVHLSIGVIVAAGLFYTTAAQAQLAPTPQKSPRTPVSKELLAGRTAALPPSHVVSGQATVLDSERLRIGEVEVRLFGVVPPQLGASYGPQARAVVDALAQGTVTCQIKDRTREGHYLAVCRNEAGADFGVELLRRGLAVAARGSLRTSDYGAPYIAAEQASQNQRLGLWSTQIPSAASEKSIREAVMKAENLRAEAEAAKAELAKAETIKAEAVKAAEAAKIDAQAALALVPAAPLPKMGEASSVKPIASVPTAEDVQAAMAKQQTLELPKIVDERSFFEKFQLLISGVLLFFTIIMAIAGTLVSKIMQRRDELKSIAAALRGELMAARSICQARLAKIAHERTDQETAWPRIRTTVFQAYVAKLGCLGADLSRQIASIYGMASDYASYYNTTDARDVGTSKRQALEALVQHIEEVTPRLTQIETMGALPKAPKPVSFKSALPSPSASAKPLSLSTLPLPPDGPGTSSPLPSVKEEGGGIVRETMTLRMAEAKAEIVSEGRSIARNGDINRSDKESELRAARTKMVQTKPKMGVTQNGDVARNRKAASASTKPSLQEKPVLRKSSATASSSTTKISGVTKAPKAAVPPVSRIAPALDDAAQSARKALAAINFKSPIMERLSKIKTFAAARIELDKKIPERLEDFTIPDYANLTEEELEALLYAEEEIMLASPAGKASRAK